MYEYRNVTLNSRACNHNREELTKVQHFYSNFETGKQMSSQNTCTYTCVTLYMYYMCTMYNVILTAISRNDVMHC